MSGKKMKVAIASGIAAVVAVAASAIAQTGTPSPTATPQKPAAREGMRPQRLCGHPGKALGIRERFGRVVHAEAKVQLQEGFATMITDRGEITAVDGDRVTIKRADGESVSVRTGERTRVCRNGEPAQVSDLKKGDRAAIFQSRRDGETVVRGIRAFSPDYAPPAGQERPKRDRRLQPSAPKTPGETP
jgi:Cu/Ag efflux protein CusF